MAALTEFILDQKPEGMSTEKYAKNFGLRGASMYYYKSGDRAMNLRTFHEVCQHFKDDPEILSRLLSLASGVDGNFIPST